MTMQFINVFVCVSFLFSLATAAILHPGYIKALKTQQCPTIVSRDEWGALPEDEIEYMITPVRNVIIAHTVTPLCNTKEQCSSRVANIQKYHMTEKKMEDIGYNFLIGSDGNVYEGRGWHLVGGHTSGYNYRSLGIALIGNFSEDLPNKKQLDALKNLLECGVNSNVLDVNYKLFGHRQVMATKSPGDRLFNEIKTWEHWENNA